MTTVEPMVVRRLPQWLYKLRDAIEISKHIPPNSPISTVVHTGMGMAGAAAVTIGVAHLKPPRDPANPNAWNRDNYLTSARNTTMAAGALTVFITAGVQLGTPQHVPLPRGTNAMYFLGVGAWAFANFVVPQYQDAWES